MQQAENNIWSRHSHTHTTHISASHIVITTSSHSLLAILITIYTAKQTPSKTNMSASLHARASMRFFLRSRPSSTPSTASRPLLLQATPTAGMSEDINDAKNSGGRHTDSHIHTCTHPYVRHSHPFFLPGPAAPASPASACPEHLLQARGWYVSLCVYKSLCV